MSWQMWNIPYPRAIHMAQVQLVIALCTYNANIEPKINNLNTNQRL